MGKKSIGRCSRVLRGRVGELKALIQLYSTSRLGVSERVSSLVNFDYFGF